MVSLPIKLWLTLFLAVGCGVLGRMGGSGNYPRWMRVINIPVLMAIQAYAFGVHSWWLLLMIPCAIGAISTYYDVIYKNLDNHWLHGFGIGLACFPIAIANGHWIQLGISAILGAILMGIWQKIVKNDVLQEFGRYFIVPWMVLIIV